MPKVKVTHALFSYKAENGKRVDAFRGQVIDVPQEVFDATPEAFIAPDEELSTPGTLVQLIEEPGDEHITQYLSSGTAKEIIAQLPEYTTQVKDRLLLAERGGAGRPSLLAALGDADAINEAQGTTPAQTQPVTDGIAGVTTEDEVTSDVVVPETETESDDKAKSKTKK